MSPSVAGRLADTGNPVTNLGDLLRACSVGMVAEDRYGHLWAIQAKADDAAHLGSIHRGRDVDAINTMTSWMFQG